MCALFAAWSAVQRIYGSEELEKELRQLNLTFMSSESCFLSCGGFYSSGPFHLLYFNSNGAAWDLHYDKELNHLFQRRSIFFTFLHACLALCTKAFSGKTTRPLWENSFCPCVGVFPEPKSEKELSFTGNCRYKEVCVRRALLGLALPFISSNFTLAFRMKHLGSQTLALYLVFSKAL